MSEPRKIDRDDVDRALWLARRRKGIGGSEVAAVLGVHPSRTEYDVWASKLHGVEEDDNDAMRMGRLLEPAVLQAFTDRTGMLWRPPSEAEKPIVRDFQIATPDALLADGSGGVEAKVVTNEWAARRFGEPGTDEVPEEYWLQCHWYLDATNTDRWFLVALLPDFDLRVYELRRDKAIEDAVRRRVADWHRKHIVAGIAPAPTRRDRDAIAHAFPRETDGVMVTAPELEPVLEQYVAAKEAEREAAKVASECEAEIVARIGGHTGLLAGDWRATWKAQGTGEIFDLAEFRKQAGANGIRAQMEALMAPYIRKKRDARVLRVKRSER